MIPVAELADLNFFASIAPDDLRVIAESAEQRQFPALDFIAKQHDKADSADFLRQGRAQALLRFEGVDDLVIETITKPGSMIGWSAFRPPYRYTASIRCETPCTLIRIPRTAFDTAFKQNPKLEYLILQRTAAVVADRLSGTASLLMPSEPATDSAPASRSAL